MKADIEKRIILLKNKGINLNDRQENLIKIQMQDLVLKVLRKQKTKDFYCQTEHEKRGERCDECCNSDEEIDSERSTKNKLMNCVTALIDIRNWNEELTKYWGSKSERARRVLYGLRDEEKNVS